MSYNSSIPQLTSPTIQSQQQIRSNFQTIQSIFSNNHMPISKEFQGMHRVLTMRPQLAGSPVTGANQVAFYNELVAGVANLFFTPNNAQTPIQLTYGSISTGLQSTNPDVYFVRQYSFSAGPFVIYGGRIIGAVAGQTVTLTPTTTLLYVGLVTANNTGSLISPPVNVMSAPVNISGSSFDIGLQAGLTSTRDVYYLAIGQP